MVLRFSSVGTAAGTSRRVAVDAIVAAQRYVHDFTRRRLPVVADKYRGREAVQRGSERRRK